MAKKRKITEEIYADSCFSSCYILSDFIAVANRLIDKYGDVNVTLDSGYNNISTLLTIERDETDEEFDRRVKAEAKEKQRKAKADIEKKERDLELIEEDGFDEFMYSQKEISGSILNHYSSYGYILGIDLSYPKPSTFHNDYAKAITTWQKYFKDESYDLIHEVCVS